MCTDPWADNSVRPDGTCDGECIAQKFDEIRCATTGIGPRVAVSASPITVDSDTSEAARRANSETASDPHSTRPRQAPMSVPTAGVADTLDPMIQRARERAIAVEFLVLARDDYDRAGRVRQLHAYTAHQHGVTFREIGEVFGVSESTARSLARAWEDSL